MKQKKGIDKTRKTMREWFLLTRMTENHGLARGYLLTFETGVSLSPVL